MKASRAMRTVAVVLAGCGVHDGSEIHEAVITLLALDRAGARVIVAAPNVALPQVIDHQTGEQNRFDSRNARIEAARIARGPVMDLADLQSRSLDALVIPGGFGAVKVLSDYARNGRRATVNPEVARLLKEMHGARKTVGLWCTAPVLAARVLGPTARPELTIGRDAVMASDLESWGAKHWACDVRGIVVDRENRIVTTPAYMLAQSVREAADGIERAVRAVMES